jgi:carboxyl-terminal processing protease
VIVKVDSQEIDTLTADEIFNRITGEEGTWVILEVLRGGSMSQYSLQRRPITLKNVTSGLLRTGQQIIGYIKIQSFSEIETCNQFRSALRDLEAKGATGLVLDLRANPGGQLIMGNCVASSVLPAGSTLLMVKPIEQMKSTSIGSESHVSPSDTGKMIAKQISHLPMVVLINHSSASASEIVAGALRDHNRAWLVGTRSFGKGTVQGGSMLYEGAGLVLFETIQRFYQPDGTTNQLIGIQPHFEVFESRDMKKENPVLREAEAFPDAYGAVNPAPPLRRSQEAAEIKKCVEAQLKSTPEEFDHQLLYAQLVLACDRR